MTERTAGRRRVVVTGVGLLTPVGNDVDATWQALLAGKSGAGPITQFEATEDFDVRFACEVKGFEPERYMDRKEMKRTDRFAQFAIATAQQAMESAGLADSLDGIDRDRVGVLIGSGIGGTATFEEQTGVLLERGPQRISPNFCTVSACASSAHAVGTAFRIVQRGEADVMIAGGTEATVTPLTMAGFAAMKALSTRNDSPETASRPFDATRDGFVLGEGSG